MDTKAITRINIKMFAVILYISISFTLQSIPIC